MKTAKTLGFAGSVPAVFCPRSVPPRHCALYLQQLLSEGDGDSLGAV